MEYVIVGIIVLAIFGPKTLQSLARNAGRATAQANAMKDQILSDLSVDDMVKVKESMSKVPRNSQQAIQMLLSSDEKEKISEEKSAQENKSSTTKDA